MSSVRLKAVAFLRTTLSSQGERPFLSLDVIESGTGRLVHQAEVPLRPPPEAGAAEAAPGDVLFGKLRPYLSKSLLVGSPSYASTELLCLRPNHGTDSRWLAYVVQSRGFVEWTVATSDGTKMPRTSWEKAGGFRVDRPGLGEQRAIADFLDAETARIDALIAKKRRLVELLTERRWLVLADLIASVEPPRVPMRRAVSTITDGPFGSAFSSSDYSENGVAVVRLGNIGFAEWRGQDLAYLPDERFAEFRRHQIAQGDLLIAGLGDARNHAGRACVAPGLGKAIVKGKCFCARVNRRTAVPEYLAMFCSSPLGAEAIAIEARGSTRLMINLDIMKAIPVPLPSTSEQAMIVEQVQRAWARTARTVDSLQRQVDLLVEHRLALITAAVTGELSVPGVAA